MKEGYVYILANRRNGTLYTGVTSNLPRRIYEHKMNLLKGFAQRYEVNQLVYYEGPGEILAAISREKQIKRWRRAWKLQLIEKENPDWLDLYNKIL